MLACVGFDAITATIARVRKTFQMFGYFGFLKSHLP